METYPSEPTHQIASHFNTEAGGLLHTQKKGESMTKATRPLTRPPFAIWVGQAV